VRRVLVWQIDMMEALYSQKEVDALREKIARQEAREEGAWDMVFSLVRDNSISKTIGAKKLGVSMAEFDKKYKAFCLVGC